MAIALGVSGGPDIVEHRGSGGNYTDAILSQYFAGATASGVQAAATAGVQAASGIVARALVAATIDGDGGAVDPHVLEDVGTDLVRAGRFLGRLTVVYGAADPESWRYSLHMGGPSSARTVSAVAAEVVNVRLNSDSYRPWEGIAPLNRAAASGELYARLSNSLSSEAEVVVARLVPLAQGLGQTTAKQPARCDRRDTSGAARTSRDASGRDGCRALFGTYAGLARGTARMGHAR